MTKRDWKSGEAPFGESGERKFRPDDDSEGLIIEGVFEEITQENQPESTPDIPPEKPMERRRLKNRRVKTSRPLFETRAGDRRKSERILDMYI